MKAPRHPCLATRTPEDLPLLIGHLVLSERCTLCRRNYTQINERDAAPAQPNASLAGSGGHKMAECGQEMQGFVKIQRSAGTCHRV